MPRNTARLSQRAPVSFLGSLAVSVGVCWHLLACHVHEMPWGYQGNVWRVSGESWVVFMEIGGPQMCLGGIWVLKPCSMEWKHYFGTAQNGTVFCQLTILRPQITKMAACKLSKNDWFMPFFAIFRFTREKLLVTVSFDHPVIQHLRGKTRIAAQCKWSDPDEQKSGFAVFGKANEGATNYDAKSSFLGYLR